MKIVNVPVLVIVRGSEAPETHVWDIGVDGDELRNEVFEAVRYAGLILEDNDLDYLMEEGVWEHDDGYLKLYLTRSSN